MKYKRYAIKCLLCGNDTFDFQWDDDHAVYKCENCHNFFNDGQEHAPVEDDSVLRTMISLTAYTSDPSVAEKVKTILEDANLEEILIMTCPDFHGWVETLATEPVPGLGKACRNRIRQWCNGGGDNSTKEQINNAIEDLENSGYSIDVPRTLAEKMYENISDYCKTPFEASVLIMDMIKESLYDCRTGSEENTE